MQFFLSTVSWWFFSSDWLNDFTGLVTCANTNPTRLVQNPLKLTVTSIFKYDSTPLNLARSLRPDSKDLQSISLPLSWLILLIFKELSPKPIGLGFAIKGQAVGGFQMKEFINVVGNKRRRAVEYWLRARSDWSNWWGFVRKNVGEVERVHL